MTTSTFIGETGVSLVPGTMDYSRALQTNKQHGSAHLKKAETRGVLGCYWGAAIGVHSSLTFNFCGSVLCPLLKTTTKTRFAAGNRHLVFFSNIDEAQTCSTSGP